ncbi:MAG: kinase/pyrophosphorylase [bacterium]|nr:kinase/pyrophosphorylase [bacterium]
MSAQLIGSQGHPLNVLVLSDATGATAEAMVTSALVHFEEAKWIIRRHALIRTSEQIVQVLDDAGGRECVVAYTFVSPRLSSELTTACRERNIPCVDILQPLIKSFAEALGREPEESPGTFRYRKENMFRLASAIEFALRHDDGQHLDSVDEAEVLILGLPRCGKTPTAMYLSCRAVRAATVPIIKDSPLPDAVTAAECPKVGLRISMDRLLQIRSRAASSAGTDAPWYKDKLSVFAELEYCEDVFRSIPNIKIVNVTNRSVEEIADLILRDVL